MELECVGLGELQIATESFDPLKKLAFTDTGEDVVAALRQRSDEGANPGMDGNKASVLVLGRAVAAAQADVEHAAALVVQPDVLPEHLLNLPNAQTGVGQSGDRRLLHTGGAIDELLHLVRREARLRSFLGLRQLGVREAVLAQPAFSVRPLEDLFADDKRRMNRLGLILLFHQPFAVLVERFAPKSQRQGDLLLLAELLELFEIGAVLPLSLQRHTLCLDESEIRIDQISQRQLGIGDVRLPGFYLGMQGQSLTACLQLAAGTQVHADLSACAIAILGCPARGNHGHAVLVVNTAANGDIRSLDALAILQFHRVTS